MGTVHRTAVLALAPLAAVLALPAAAPAADGAPATAAAPGALQVVLDSSGSMAAADPSGGTKMEAARAALAGVVDALPEGAVVGVRAYGGTYEDQARGCTDTRLVVPMGALDRTAARRALDGLQPKGYTPLAASLQAAADDLRGEGPRRVLLVSDGEETCGGDPCEVARALDRDGVDVVVDTVGYAADEATRTQLQCIAEETGGTYTDVADGEELDLQLSRTALRAYREFTPTGEPVQGTPTPDGAPVLAPGSYVDSLEVDEVTHYVVDVPPGALPYVAATTVAPRADYDTSSLEGVSVTLQTAEGRCEYEPGAAVDQSSGVKPVTTVAALPPPDREDPVYGCGLPGRYVVEVERNASRTEVPRLPVELLVLLEPAVRDVASLPDPTVPVPADPELPARSAGAPREALGGGSFATAPVLEPGTHRDGVLAGETLFYRVPVGWGQRLNVAATVEGTRVGNDFAPVEVRLLNPARQAMDPNGQDGGNDVFVLMPEQGERASTAHAWTAPVTYRNREAELTSEVTTASLAGDQYVVVTVQEFAGSLDVTEGGLLPLTLTVEVAGEEQGAPDYTGTTQGASEDTGPAGGPAGEARGEAAAEPRRETGGDGLSPVAYAGGGVAAALLAGGLLLAPWLRRGGRS